MRFRLVLYETDSENKHDAERRYEFMSDKQGIWWLWFNLKMKCKHVEIYSLNGELQHPEKGLQGLIDYNV